MPRDGYDPGCAFKLIVPLFDRLEAQVTPLVGQAAFQRMKTGTSSAYVGLNSRNVGACTQMHQRLVGMLRRNRPGAWVTLTALDAN